MPVDVRRIETRRRYERILQIPLVFDVLARLGAPALKHRFELIVVDVDSEPEVGHDGDVGRHHIRQNASVHHRHIDGRHVADRELRVVVKSLDLRRAVFEEPIEEITKLLGCRVLEQQRAVTRCAIDLEDDVPDATLGVVNVEDVGWRRDA